MPRRVPSVFVCLAGLFVHGWEEKWQDQLQPKSQKTWRLHVAAHESHNDENHQGLCFYSRISHKAKSCTTAEESKWHHAWEPVPNSDTRCVVCRWLTAVAGGSSVAAVRAVTVENGPGLAASASVFTTTGRTPEGKFSRDFITVLDDIHSFCLHLDIIQLLLLPKVFQRKKVSDARNTVYCEEEVCLLAKAAEASVVSWVIYLSVCVRVRTLHHQPSGLLEWLHAVDNTGQKNKLSNIHFSQPEWRGKHFTMALLQFLHPMGRKHLKWSWHEHVIHFMATCVWEGQDYSY